MGIDWVRRYCMSLPQATESVQWANDLVFKIGGKMFAVLALEPGNIWLSFKCSPEIFTELVERPGVIPAPYLARYSWVALETEDTLSASETKQMLHASYELVFQKLPQKVRASIL